MRCQKSTKESLPLKCTSTHEDSHSCNRVSKLGPYGRLNMTDRNRMRADRGDARGTPSCRPVAGRPATVTQTGAASRRPCRRSRRQPVPSLPAMGPLAPPPAERSPSLESIYRVSLAVDLCEGNKIISFRKFISPQPVGSPSKRKKIRGPKHVPSVPIG